MFKCTFATSLCDHLQTLPVDSDHPYFVLSHTFNGLPITFLMVTQW